MTQEEMTKLAKSTAAKYDLFPELVCAIVEQESNWDPFAIRYEPGFWQHYILPLVNRGQIVGETEARARAISWGLCQVMGQTAREQGFQGKYLSALCDPEVGLEMGCKVLAVKFAHAQGNTGKALQLWNGRQTYAAEVLARVKNYTEGSL